MNNATNSQRWFKHFMSTALLVILMLGLLVFGWWATVSELDIVTRAAGTVIPSSRVQSIQSLDGGILEEIKVSEGEVVKKGQLLLRINREKAQVLLS